MCPGILPRRLFCRGGASVVRRDAALNRMRDLNANAYKQTEKFVLGYTASRCQAVAATPYSLYDNEGRF
jgi:hypothetical protein